MSKRDKSDDPQPKRAIYKMRERAREVSSIAERQLMDYNQLDQNVHIELAHTVLEYHKQLRDFRFHDVVEPEDYPDIRPIKRARGRQSERVITSSGNWGDSARIERQPMVLEIPARELLAMMNELHDLAVKLGFSASVSATPAGGSKLPSPNKLGPINAEAAEFEDSAFFKSLYDDIEGTRSGGAIVIVDAEDARTGVGKTAAAVAMAEFFAWYFDYELQERDGVLSGQEYLDLFKQHPNEEQVSVCVWDEAVGAGSGDARRSMAQENVDLGRAWQIMRDRRVITFVTLPDWGDLDSRLQKLADYRVWCRRSIGDMQAYEIGTTFEGGDLRTRGLGPGEGAEPISFPDVTDDNDLYISIKEKKDKVQESDKLDAEDALDNNETAEKEDGPSEAEKKKSRLESIADEVIADLKDYTGEHPSNGMKFVDEDLIEVDYPELSARDADKVKKVVQREVEEL